MGTTSASQHMPGPLGLSLLGLICWHLSATAAYDCSIAPISLKLQNATFKNGVAINRGIEINLGDNQTVGLRPSWVWNNTRIRNKSDCTANNANSTQETACEGASGSVFEPDNSFTELVDNQWDSQVRTVDAPPILATLERGVTQAQFADGTTVTLATEIWSAPSMPVSATDSQKGANKSLLALGPDSSVLETFLNNSKVPSSFHSIFFGSRSLDYPTDGELIVGGWNAARVAGPFVNYTISAFPMSVACPLRVKVKQITLGNVNGSNPLMTSGYGTNQSISACIDPLQNQLTFPDALYNVWANITQHPTTQPTDGSEHWTSQTYPIANEPLIGDLTIELEGGYTSTIPHYELVSYERGIVYSDLGEYGVTNTSRIMTGVGNGMTDYGENFGILLGGVFLAGTYVFVDYERGHFGLAPAKLNNVDTPDVRKICSLNISTTPNSPQSTNSGMPNSTSTGSSSDGGLSISDIIGIAVSIPGLIVAVLALWVGWMTYKHHQRHGKVEHNSKHQQLREGNSDEGASGRAEEDRRIKDGAIELRESQSGRGCEPTSTVSEGEGSGRNIR